MPDEAVNGSTAILTENSVLANGGPRCDYDFDKDQIWLRPKQALSFIDETKELIGGYERGDTDSRELSEALQIPTTDNVPTYNNDVVVERPNSSSHVRHNSHGSAVQALAMLAGKPSPSQSHRSVISGFAGSPSSAPGYLDVGFDQRPSIGRAESYSGVSLDGRTSSGMRCFCSATKSS